MERSELTLLLDQWREGDVSALDRLIPLVYPHLRRIAGALMRGEAPGHSLQATALVHDAYLRLAKGPVHVENRAHFFALSAQVMRRMLVDYARSKRARRRALEQEAASPDELRGENVLALHESLDRLAELDPRKASAMEMIYFGGMTQAEAATVLKVSLATLERETRLAKAWLGKVLRSSGAATALPG